MTKKLTKRRKLILEDLTRKPSKREPRIYSRNGVTYLDELDESFINAEWLHLTDEDKRFIEEVKQKLAKGEELDSPEYSGE